MGLAVVLVDRVDPVEMVDDVAATAADATAADATCRAEIQATWVSEGWG